MSEYVWAVCKHFKTVHIGKCSQGSTYIRYTFYQYKGQVGVCPHRPALGIGPARLLNVDVQVGNSFGQLQCIVCEPG